MKTLPEHEKLLIAASLEDYHKVFYTFWEMSSIGFSDEIDTACVVFSEYGNPLMMLNETFWYSLTKREQQFVVCHECLHVMLDHGRRNAAGMPGATPELINIAQDITINEMIESLFGLKRTEVRNWEKYCWIDTCFKNPSSIQKGMPFTYYLEILIREAARYGTPDVVTLDQHVVGGDETANRWVEEILAGDLNNAQLEKLVKASSQNAGADPSTMSSMLDRRRKPVKVNFGKLVQNLKRKSFGHDFEEVETFVTTDRRFDQLAHSRDLSLPGFIEQAKVTRSRLSTAVFMDVSGSCVSYANKFQSVLRAFELEKNTFDLRAFIFDTSVREVNPGDSIRMGGGTAFGIIEQKIQALKEASGKYPDCVIVITDGEGTPVTPEFPNRWIWLMTPQPTLRYVNKKSRSFLLSDVIL